MQNAAARGHPLHAARAEQTGVALVVVMAHAPGQHIGDGLEAAVRMFRKTRQIIARFIRTELVEHQKRIEIRQLGRTDHTRESHARAIARRVSAHDLFDAPLLRR